MPEPWRAQRLRIAGIQRVLAARSIATTGRRRGGFPGAVDEIRNRAESALERGVPEAEAALARGFVLGQDDRIDPVTIDEFRASGLAHLLAVSGQNVLLLALLAIPVLAVLGVPLRARLVVVVALIVLYVPITGAGPSIQRAAVMGVAALVALLAGRPSLRWYALLLAAALTLAINPRAAADVGWQLSFAAVVGILLWARPLASLVLRRAGNDPSRLRRGLAEGVGVTVAATLATAPISALHFETLSLASLPANLLALPAVAPVMWLGMLSAALGQIAWIPVEPLNWLCSLLIAYIAQVAHWLGTPGWASIEVTPPSPPDLAALMIGLSLLAALAGRSLVRRRKLHRRNLTSIAPAAAAAGLLAIALLVPFSAPRAPAATPGPGLVITVFDVGQGDAILLQPHPGRPILVDAGPPGTELPAMLAEQEVERLAAVIVTHDESDHAGGLGAVLDRIPTETLIHADAGRALRATTTTAGAELARAEAGAVLRSGALRLDVLWPPPSRGLPDPSADPNDRSIVIRARWREFDALLTGDGEAEAVPLDPGRIDLLKIAHHGSEDTGLPALLERAHPALAVISAGADNPYGHPHPTTLAALSDAGVPLLRTDIDGEIEVTVSEAGLQVTG